MSAESKPVSPSPVVTSRRRFIQVGVATLGMAWAGTWLQTRLFPQAAAQEAQPVKFALADLPVGGAHQISYGSTPLLVLRNAESVKAFSLICTHLGCTIEWQAARQEFRCPCHEGRFDQFGEVLVGPPVVPLEQVAVRIEGDQVIVGA